MLREKSEFDTPRGLALKKNHTITLASDCMHGIAPTCSPGTRESKQSEAQGANLE